jgi:hypothetical protein
VNKRAQSRYEWCRPIKKQDKAKLRELIMARLPIKDDPQQPILIYGEPRLPGPGRGDVHRAIYQREVIDATEEVHRMLKRGVLKRVRKYGFGHSGHAGHTHFVATQPTPPESKI